MSNNRDYPEILKDLRSSIADSALKKGLGIVDANELAHESAELIRKNWGGMLIYICKGRSYELSERDLKIWNEFNNNNHHEICKKYNISIQWLYKIIANQKGMYITDVQEDLFD